MLASTDAGNFDASLGCLLAPALGELATRLSEVPGLEASESRCIHEAAREALLAVLHAKLTRLLVLELNAARVTGRLGAEDPQARFQEFLALSSTPEFWREQAANYPNMPAQVERIVRQRCAAALAFAQRLATDRERLAELPGGPRGALVELSFGAGDSHRGGSTVAVLRFEQGACVYKPRPVDIDVALLQLIAALRAAGCRLDSVRVPQALHRGDYGWTEFVGHRYAADADELASFYRGLGQWLALMRLLAGSDLHAENIIACGPQPVVVDCETLFTPHVPPTPSGLGEAADAAAALVAGSVLSIGLLPGRGMGLGWRGIDNSAAGSLPSQQPKSAQPDVIAAGTDSAHIGLRLMDAPVAQNLPSPEPALAQYWPEVLAAFVQLTEDLQALDARGGLAPELARFADCTVRVVPRATEVYAEVGRMLWHPVSLHGPEAARRRAFELFKRMAANVATAPGSDEVIEAEIEDLLHGDVPFFTTTPARGELDGPGGTRWLPPTDLIEQALQRWRTADFALEREVIRSALVSAYINQGWMPDEVCLLPAQAEPVDLDHRRRAHAATVLRQLRDSALRGGDGSVSWIAPVLGPTGWSIQPLEVDLYGGVSGVAVLLAAYQREVAAGRADPLDGLDDLLQRCLHTLELARIKRARLRAEGARLRPPLPGAYLGVASQIWAQLLFDRWGLPGDPLAHALSLIDELPEAAAADDLHDLLSGKAGAIPVLLALHARSGEARALALAVELGDALLAAASRSEGRAFWAHAQWPEGIGGFAHGSTGIAWALEQLAAASGEARFAALAEEARAFEDALWDEAEGGWRDLRDLEGAPMAAAWCHGAVGIGLSVLPVDGAAPGEVALRQLQRAAAFTQRLGLGWNHCLCHGDTSAWELVERAEHFGVCAPGSRLALEARLLASLDTHGAVCGLARDAFVPGLLPGVGGVAYQLLRLHPESDLPSLCLPGRLQR